MAFIRPDAEEAVGQSQIPETAPKQAAVQAPLANVRLCAGRTTCPQPWAGEAVGGGGDPAPWRQAAQLSHSETGPRASSETPLSAASEVGQHWCLQRELWGGNKRAQ